MKYNKLDRKEKAMTLRLSGEQDKKLIDLFELLHVRTKSNAIIKMIDEYPKLFSLLQETQKKLKETSQSTSFLADKLNGYISHKLLSL
jgi:hypothetical protein